MTDYLNEFTPDWPHGHVIVFPDGTTKPFVVKVWDWPGEFPIWGHMVGYGIPWRCRADGSGSGNAVVHRLRNAAPPKRVPREHWINYYANSNEGSGPFASREVADTIARLMSVKPDECVRFREVIEEEA